MKLFLRKYWFFASICVLLLFSFLIRVVKLDQIPAGLTWDEAAIGYNGYAVWETRRDEWLHRLPVSFQSFGDYKAPLAIYINGFFTYFLSFDFLRKTELPLLKSIQTTMSHVFNLNVWTVRFPFVLSGVVGIAGFVFFTNLLLSSFFSIKKEASQKTAVLLALFLSLSPWHLHFTRAGFESGMALTFLILMEYFLLSFLHSLQFSKVEKTGKKYLLILLAVLMLASSMYTYHSAKIVAPLLFVFTLMFFTNSKKLFETKIVYSLIVGFVFSVILFRPMLVDTFSGSGGERFSQTSVFSQNSDSSFIPMMGIVASNYLQHFTPQFLFMGETTTLRHGDGQWGVMYMLDGVFILIALVTYLQKKGKLIEAERQRRFVYFCLFWVFVGFIPAAIGTEIPHANRALLALPGFLLLSGAGFVEAIAVFTDEAKIFNISQQKMVTILLSISYLFLSYGYVHHYFSVFSKESEQDFYYGYVPAMEFAQQYEKDVEKILFTSQYGQPYIYALFVRKTNPIWYQGGSLVKFEFSDNIKESDLQRKNTVIVATPDEIDPKFADQLVIAPDGKVKFILIKPRE